MLDTLKGFLGQITSLGKTHYILGGVYLFMLAVLVVGFVQNPEVLQPSYTAQGAVNWLLFSLGFWAISIGLYFTKFRYFIHIIAMISIGVITIPLVGFGTWAAVLFLCLSAFACSEALCRKVLLFDVNSLILRVGALLIGLAVYVTFMNVLVHFPVNYNFTYLCLMGIALILNRCAIFGLFAQARDYCGPKDWDNIWEYGAFNLICYLLLMHFLYAAQSEQMFDALAVHLAVPHQVFVNHLWDFDFVNHIWAVMPMNGDWLYTMAYVLGGEFAARFSNMAMLLLLLLMIVETSKKFVGRGLAYLAGALFLSSPLVHLESSSLFIESVWAAFSVAAIIILMRYRTEKKLGYLYAAMLLLGAALATKVITIFLLVIVAFVVVFDLFKQADVYNALKVLAVSIAIVTCFGTLPYINAYLLTQNPVYPFFNALFQSPYLPTNWTFDQPHYKYGTSLATLYDITFHSDHYAEARVGVPGYQYLVFLPLALLAVIRKPRYEVLAMLGIGVAFLVLVFQFQSYLRYVYPVFPLFSIVIAYLFAVSRESNRFLLSAFIAGALVFVCLNLWSMPGAAGAYRDFPIKNTALGKRDPIAARKAIEFLNLTCGTRCRVGVLSGATIAGLDGKAFIYGWHTWDFAGKIRAANDMAAITKVVKEYRLNRLLVIDGDTNLNKAVVDFIEHNPQKVFSYQGVSVYKIDRLNLNPTFQEMLVNNDFHDGLAGWAVTGKVEYDKKDQRVRVSDQNFLTQVVLLKDGALLRASVTARCDAEDAFIRLQANWHNKAGKFLSATIIPKQCGRAYKTFSETMEAPPNVAYAIVYLVAHGAYEIDVKEISFAAY